MKISLAKVFFLLVLLSCLILVIRPIGDPDFWWHIKTGQLILRDQVIPHVDSYSFSAYGKPWIAHEWLAEVILFLTFRIGGISFTQVIFGLLTLTAFGLSIACIMDKSNPYAMGISLFLGFLMATPVLWARPQILSLLNFSILYFFLHKFSRTGKIKFIYPIPIIMIFWVNEHGSYILGLGIIGIFIIGHIFDNYKLDKNIDFKVFRVFSKELLVLCSLFLISFLATFINPNGAKIIFYPFQTINDPSLQAYIQEWASPDFHDATWIPLALMFLALIGFGLMNKKPFSITEVLLVIVFGFMALLAVKQVMYFAIVSIPVLANLISSVFPYQVKVPKIKYLSTITGIASLMVMLSIGAYNFFKLDQKQSDIIRSLFPVDAVNYIEKEEINGKIFNSYNWGGYLIWRLYPVHHVYIDGRCDMYGASFVHRYVDISTTKPGWQKALSEDGINYVLIEPDTYLAYALNQSYEWTPIYSDTISVLFERKKP